MRIIAGTKKGMKLFSPPTDVSRPFTDKAKESIFNILFNYYMPSGCMVADIFCGVGSNGLESLSRSAEYVTFVDRDPKTLSTLKKNISRTGFNDRCRVVRADAFSVGAPVRYNQRKYDLVFVDPPYKLSRKIGEGSRVAALMETLQDQVAAESVVILRTRKGTDPPDNYGSLSVFDRRNWGSMNITFLRPTPQ